MQIRNSQTPDSNDTSTYNNIQDIENQTSNIDKLSNASNDEGNGNLLKTFFEKSVSEGYHTDNFAGTNYEKNVIDGTYNNNAVIYSDNLYHKGNTSIILGGTVDASFSKDNGNNIDYNVYSYGKYKAKKLTYGLGAINTKNNGVNNVNISAGAQHNSTGIYAIIEKDLNMIPGLPTSSKTHIKVGIGKESGLLDPDEYNPKNKNIENIDKIDVQEEFVESKEGSVYGIDDIDYKSVKNNTVVNLIISDTDSCKEYGIKGGYIFRKVTKKENYAFAMPYGQISNTNADSKEGVKFVLGANAGQNLNTKNGWNILTKGVLEASRHIVCGQRPSDYILGNINFKANNNKFNGEVSVGAYFDSDKTFCKYLESKVGYTINKNLSAGVKAGIANYKYSTNENKDFQVAAGVHYTF